MYDLVIRNGFLVDGTGNPGFFGDLAVAGDKIAAIGSSISGEAKKVIDAGGRMVCPGFIDPHVHEETVALHDGGFETFLKEGVTTLINGNCGHSVTPGDSSNVYEYFVLNGLISTEGQKVYNEQQPHWQDLAGYMQIIEQKGINVNMGFLLGHGTIRWTAMGGSFPRKPSPEEEKAILGYVREGMEQGAVGLSTGLAYIPSRYADTDEIVRCCEVVKEYDGVYATHARYYLGILESTLEAIEIGRRAGCRVQVSHLTATSPESFDAILEARREGVEIAVDTIPRSTGHCVRKDRLYQFITATSDELFTAGDAGVKAAIQTPEGRAIIRKDEFIFHHGMENIFMVATGNPAIEKKSVAQIARERGVSDPEDVFFELLGDDNMYTFWLGGPSRSDFPLGPHPENIRKNPLVMAGSDAIFGEPWDPGSWYELQRPGAFPIFMAMNREGGVPVEETVRRNTSMAAQQFRLTDRGLLRPGMQADVSVIDLERYRYPLPTEMDPTVSRNLASGVDYVLVNGQFALYEGEVTKARSGKVLRGNR